MRPSWAVAATAIAVWFGAAGCVGLLLRKRWATPLFITSLAALVVQNVWLFLMSGVVQAEPLGLVLQAGVPACSSSASHAAPPRTRR